MAKQLFYSNAIRDMRERQSKSAMEISKELSLGEVSLRICSNG
jgi:hypothetical protein